MLNQIIPTKRRAARKPGVLFRGFRGPGDFAIMAALINQAHLADGMPEGSTAEDLAHYYASPNHDPRCEVLIVELNGRPAAYSRVYWVDQPNQDGTVTRIYRSSTFILPEWRPGLASAVLAFNEGRIRQLAADHPAELLKFFEVTVPDTQSGAADLLESAGYGLLRHFFVMQRPLDGEIPEAAMPAGLELRPVKPEHLRKIWDAIEEAFLDHWGFTPHDEADYERWRTNPSADLSLWKVAWDGDQVAGLTVNLITPGEEGSTGVLQAWTEPLCVRRPWRRLGLGRALLLESQREMKTRGMQFAALEVDTENPNQALHLYESCGYRAERRWDLYRKAMK